MTRYMWTRLLLSLVMIVLSACMIGWVTHSWATFSAVFLLAWGSLGLSEIYMIRGK